ncbi:MAG: hypothetical protein IPN38_11240 [Flavobacteriales bacterium]|nr:hypothetical protein [Flavobacteriales bacterium]
MTTISAGTGGTQLQSQVAGSGPGAILNGGDDLTMESDDGCRSGQYSG